MPTKPKKVKASGVELWISYPVIYLSSKGCYYYNEDGDKVWCCGPNKGKVEKKESRGDS